MGNHNFTQEAYDNARSTFTTAGKASTARGEETVQQTGKLDPLVDPAEYGVIRESRMRLEPRPTGGFEVTVGAPGTLEYRLDTTSSMGDNVDRALAALPLTCGLTAAVLPGRDPFYCASTFGDVNDQHFGKFTLCRGQFEVLAGRMVNQLTLMPPTRGGGGNDGEDPHYGLFGAAYLTNAYLHRIGLKSMDFTITDEPCHEPLIADQLKRIFGPEVFEKARENGHEIDPRDLPTNQELVRDVLKRTHAFALVVRDGSYNHTARWRQLFGTERVIVLPEIEYVSHVMAVVTGLTEGTLDLRSAADFLGSHEVPKKEARRIIDAVAHIPLGAQCALPNYERLPKKGDVFAAKTDLWPVDPADIPQSEEVPVAGGNTGGWL